MTRMIAEGDVDPLSTQLAELRAALTTERSRAASASGALAVEVTADGTISSWHLDESLRTADTRNVLTAFVNLHTQALRNAHAALTDANTTVTDDPRLRDTIDRLVDAVDKPRPTPDSKTSGRAESPDHSLTVEVDPTGGITKIRLTDHARSLDPRALARAIMHAQTAAIDTLQQ